MARIWFLRQLGRATTRDLAETRRGRIGILFGERHLARRRRGCEIAGQSAGRRSRATFSRHRRCQGRARRHAILRSLPESEIGWHTERSGRHLMENCRVLNGQCAALRSWPGLILWLWSVQGRGRHRATNRGKLRRRWDQRPGSGSARRLWLALVEFSMMAIRQHVREGIDRWIRGKTVTNGLLSQKLAAGGQKNNRNPGLSPHMLQVAEILRTLKQPGARPARQQRQHQDHRLLLRADRLKQALLLVFWLNVQQAKISIFIELHSDLFRYVSRLSIGMPVLKRRACLELARNGSVDGAGVSRKRAVG